MSAPFKTELTSDVRAGYQEWTRAYLRGERPPVVFAEEFTTLAMPELDAQADAADEEAADLESAAHPYLNRMKLILALAVQRDARYAHANRKFLFGLGTTNKLREDFEAVAAAAINTGAVP